MKFQHKGSLCSLFLCFVVFVLLLLGTSGCHRQALVEGEL